MSNFVHLHLHSMYSLLDGACRLNDIVSRAAELGQKAVAVTDHGVMYGAVDFYNAAKKNGVKPIIGCEVYVARRTRFDKVHNLDSSPYHLVLLCENSKGYHNLMKLVSESFISGFYNKPRVDTELLEKYHEGLICLSACLAGEVASELKDGNYDAAKKAALKYREIFGKDNFFLEIQDHGIAEQKKIIPHLIRLSEDTGIPLAATNDVHYISREDAAMQKVMLCIQTGSTVDDPSMEFPTDEFYMKSESEMLSLFSTVPEAVSITSEIADRCNVEIEFGSAGLPEYPAVGDRTEFFRNLCTKGLHEKYGETPDAKIIERMEYEISVISRMGYVDYYLIVWDFIAYAKSRGIPVGPGRGSGAGSICAYCIGITAIDPIRYNLIFERFLNPERVSMPDFDVDFCVDRRNEVIEYVASKYGKDRVAQIITFDTMLARSAVRDAGRAMGIPYGVCDSTAKLISPELNMTIAKAMEKEKKLKTAYDTDPVVRRLIDMAVKLEGMPRNTSVHAAGVVLASAPVSDFVPLRVSHDLVTTQYPMSVLESLGILKIDFLALRNLTIIDNCLKRIGDHRPDISSIPDNDEAVYRMLSAGNTSAVFQFESRGMTALVMKLKPSSIEDLTAAIALYRPGPMDSIPKYIKCKNDPQSVSYDCPELKDILSVTYGCIVYQEQVMEIFRRLAGYTYGGADKVRRAMAKKKHDVMEKERVRFIYGGTGDDGMTCPGAVANGIPEKVAESIFERMSAFASYAFNKSHAAAYAYLAYQTAWLKCHYFKEYMASVMSACLNGNSGKFMEYMKECRLSGVNIVKPSVNESGVDFTVTSEGIRFGLSAVKNIGRAAVNDVISERESFGKFSSLRDFAVRTKKYGISKKMTESLIYAGAFDGLGLCRRQMLENLDIIISVDNSIVEGQLDLFGSDDGHASDVFVPDAPEYSYPELLAMEKEVTGIYMSGHPLEEYDYLLKLSRIPDVTEINEDPLKKYTEQSEVSVFGTVISEKSHTTKKGDRMSFVTIEDTAGTIECVVFPDVWKNYGGKLRKDNVVRITGKISEKDKGKSIIASAVFTADEFQNAALLRKLCISTTSLELKNAIEELKNAAVSVPPSEECSIKVCFYLSDLRKIIAPHGEFSVRLTRESYRELLKVFPEDKLALI